MYKLSVLLENHPNDSRVKIERDGTCQTLSGRMGTGGGNVPLLLEVTTDDEDETQMLFNRFAELSGYEFNQSHKQNI